MKDVTLVCLYQRHKCWRVFEEKQLKYKTIRLISYLDQWIGWFINLWSIEWFINLCSIDWFNNPWLIDWLINWSNASSSGKKSSTRTSCPHKSKFVLKRKTFNSVFKFTHQSYMWLYQSLFFAYISFWGPAWLWMLDPNVFNAPPGNNMLMVDLCDTLYKLPLIVFFYIRILSDNTQVYFIRYMQVYFFRYANVFHLICKYIRYAASVFPKPIFHFCKYQQNCV